MSQTVLLAGLPADEASGFPGEVDLTTRHPADLVDKVAAYIGTYGRFPYAVVDNSDWREPARKATHWFVVDSRQADHEVGHPGDLVAEFDNGEAARKLADKLNAVDVLDLILGKEAPAPVAPPQPALDIPALLDVIDGRVVQHTARGGTMAGPHASKALAKASEARDIAGIIRMLLPKADAA